VGPTPRAKEKLKVNVIQGLIEGAPIFQGDFADPFVVRLPDASFVYATNTRGANVPVVRVPRNNIIGEYLGDALPNLPKWTVKGFQWAPAVWARPDGRFVLYYSTPEPSQGFAARRQCISRALGDNPAGPFVDDSSEPFICPSAQGGAIDPSVFIDGETPYLLWKSDGNCCNLPPVIYSQQLTSDGLNIAAPPSELVDRTQGWEGEVVEGPSMIRARGTYVLFYSANDWNSANYAVGVATCTTIDGPCKKVGAAPWLASAQKYSGPGGQEFFNVGAEVWMVHHGFLPGEAGTPNGQRRLYLDQLDFRGDNPVPFRTGRQTAIDFLWKVGLGVAVLVGVSTVVIRQRRRRRSDALPA